MINFFEVYTTADVQRELKLSKSTVKRLLKRGIIRANKIGGQYRILGKELLRLISPKTERKAISTYRKIKGKIKKATSDW